VAGVPLQHRFEYALTRALEAGLGGLPRSSAERIGAGLGGFVRRPLGIRVGVVRENLRLAFPDETEAWRERVAVESYRHLGREVAAMLRLSTLDPTRVRETVRIPDEDWRAFKEARAEHERGVLLVTGHYGNWEMAAAGVAARGMPISAIVKRQSNALVDARIAAARRALGVETVEMAHAPRQVPRALLGGRCVGIVGDQDARRSGVWVPFFGQPASTHRGPAVFALRVGAPLFAAVARRAEDGTYLLTGSRIDTRPTDSFEDDVVRVTGALAAHLEREIRVDPTQYLWLHKRWKTRPPEEPGPSSPVSRHTVPRDTESGE
jgi:Kdo2-lipid IVA lauroyltransferase/acyltransferase